MFPCRTFLFSVVLSLNLVTSLSLLSPYQLNLAQHRCYPFANTYGRPCRATARKNTCYSSYDRISTTLAYANSSFKPMKLPVRAQFWLSVPYVSALNIYSSFSDESLKSVKDAVARLVTLYPVLAGRIARRDPEEDEVGDQSLLCPQQGSVVEVIYSNRAFDEMFHIVDNTDIDATNLFNALESSTSNAQKAAREELEPHVLQHSLKSLDLDETQPLFQVVVGKLPNDRAYILIEVAHIIADAASFYTINEAINNIINKKDVPHLEFKVADEHIANAAHQSDKDKYHSLAWKTARLEAVKHRKQAITTLAIKKDVLSEAKLAFARDSGVPFLSSNDILMASFAELLDHHDVMCMFCDMRERDPSAAKNYIGNFARMIMFPTVRLSSDVAFIRKEILGENANIKFYYYGTNEFPDLSKDLYGSVTSWAGRTKFLQPAEATLDLHLPTSGFLKAIGVDKIIVWNPTKDDISIMTNMCEETLAQKIKESKLFKTLVDLPPASTP